MNTKWQSNSTVLLILWLAYVIVKPYMQTHTKIQDQPEILPAKGVPSLPSSTKSGKQMRIQTG